MILQQLGVFNWKGADKNLVLASLLTGSPLLLIGNHKYAKTHVANKVGSIKGSVKYFALLFMRYPQLRIPANPNETPPHSPRVWNSVALGSGIISAIMYGWHAYFRTKMGTGSAALQRSCTGYSSFPRNATVPCTRFRAYKKNIGICPG